MRRRILIIAPVELCPILEQLAQSYFSSPNRGLAFNQILIKQEDKNTEKPSFAWCSHSFLEEDYLKIKQLSLKFPTVKYFEYDIIKNPAFPYEKIKEIGLKVKRM